MCGICGIVRLQNSKPIERDTLLQMRDSLIHRGPDDAGIYNDAKAWLGSRRLSIIDLSPNGHMPMRSTNGRYIIVYNGEVYNFRQLRGQLEQKGVHFRSGTDTEVLLNLYIERGPAMLPLCHGMFALAIWDRQEQTLFAARDRLGIKPFFYAIHQGAFYFASEPKALFAAGVPAQFNPDTWPELLLFRYVSGQRTPYQRIHRLLPGHYLLIKNDALQSRCWWSLADSQPGLAASESPQIIADHFEEMFNDSVAQRRISDVPVGVLLSGGLDSSSVAATLAAQAGRDVASFTIRFANPRYDEGFWAKEVAKKWQLNYHERLVTPPEIPVLLEEATRLLDEPLAHGNDIHLLAIARLAKPHVTVLLSGEGADETMGGYGRYRIFLLPWLLRLGGLAHWLARLVPAGGSPQRALQILAQPTAQARLLFSSAGLFPADAPLQNGAVAAPEYRQAVINRAALLYTEPVRQLMYYEQSTYLQSLLDRNDRMTMGASIECRVPFLDHRLVEWLATLPTRAFFEGSRGKSILRQAMKSQLPPAVLQHKKWGFTVPWAAYFRETPSLRAWIQQLPQMDIIKNAPLYQPAVAQTVNQFLAGNNRHTSLVRQLVFISLWQAVCLEGRRQVLE